MSTSPQAQPNDSTPLKVAVVGSGPSGCFFAQMLRKQWPDAHITVFDRLPVPFGLVRYGVAPDHQHTKRIVDRFTRVFEDERTAFAGNVEIGRDVSVDELRANFHVVVIAAGISGDRVLSIPGENLPGVYGAGQMMRWINAHPDEANFSPDFGGNRSSSAAAMWPSMSFGRWSRTNPASSAAICPTRPSPAWNVRDH